MATMTLTGDQIPHFRMAVLRQAVKLEKLGMKRRGPSARSIAALELGLPTNAGYDKVLDALNSAIERKVTL